MVDVLSTETKFTDGPWTSQGWVPTWAYIPVHDARHNLVCSLYPDIGRGYGRNEVEANAHLIAASKDLYEALSAVVSYEASPDFTKWKGVIDRANSALLKASGGSSNEGE